HIIHPLRSDPTGVIIVGKKIESRESYPKFVGGRSPRLSRGEIDESIEMTGLRIPNSDSDMLLVLSSRIFQNLHRLVRYPHHIRRHQVSSDKLYAVGAPIPIHPRHPAERPLRPCIKLETQPPFCLRKDHRLEKTCRARHVALETRCGLDGLRGI